MNDSQTSAPDKHQPHPFQRGIEFPAILGSGEAKSEEAAATEGASLPGASAPSCALCGAPRDAQIHVEGKAEADAESPKWG
jgi:hypothetical protein